ncbi:MAG TPA: hypothetical protein VHO02_08820 [Fibrobacteria bacterium]|nr:hypothetical protein [Fibrobacteria bacterium]
MRSLPGEFPLYFVTDGGLTAGRPILDVVAAALRGGARLIQFRDRRWIRNPSSRRPARC